MNVWEWFSTTASVDSVLTALGLTGLAFLFATDRIITKAQHVRRVQDLIEHHARELAEKDDRIAQGVTSENYWKEAARIERERADKQFAVVGEVLATLVDVKHVLESLDRALPTAEGAAHGTE